MAEYVNKKHIQETCLVVWLCSIRSRLWLEFKTMGHLETFKKRWCYIICTVNHEELKFSHDFIV